jgi:hypothetical protein
MSSGGAPLKHRSIFSPGNARERADNFEHYWVFTQAHSGDLLEEEKDLTKKRAKLLAFRNDAVRLNRPFSPEAFYRNYVRLQDKPENLDRKTVLLTCIYKFARHEWGGSLAPGMRRRPWSRRRR